MPPWRRPFPRRTWPRPRSRHQTKLPKAVFCAYSNPPFFPFISLYIWSIWHRRVEIRGHDQTLWQALSKGKERTSWLFGYLPLNAVICRSLRRVRGLQSGASRGWRLGAELPDSRQLRSKSGSATGERDGRTRPRHTATCKTLTRPARFLERNRGVPRPRRDHGAALGEAGGDARSQACARQDGLGLRFSRGVGCVGARPEHSSRG